jgi:hypothetical protein
MPDEMPFQIFPSQFFNLSFGFLHFIFAENSRPRRNCILQNICRMSFADGDEFYVAWVSPAFLRGSLDSFFYFRQILTKEILHNFKYSKLEPPS